MFLQRNVYALHWNLISALLNNSKDVPGQGYVIMSEVAGFTVDKLYGNALYMLSEYYGDGVLLLYPWDKAKFQLANSCHLLEYTLFPTILQHLISIYAIILVSIVCTARLLSNAWERKGCKLPSDNTVSHFSLNQGLLKCMPRLCIDPDPGLQTKITAKSISSVRESTQMILPVLLAN